MQSQVAIAHVAGKYYIFVMTWVTFLLLNLSGMAVGVLVLIIEFQFGTQQRGEQENARETNGKCLPSKLVTATIIVEN